MIKLSMPMSSRLLPVAVGFVILPTAILSLLAFRGFQEWEASLARRMDADAASSINALAAQADMDLARTLEAVNAGVSATLERGGVRGQLEALEKQLQKTQPLVRHIYVFMSPWGFLYPEAPEGEAASPLTGALRDAFALEGEKTFSTIQNTPYCFSRLPGRRGLYAGYEVNADVFMSRLAERLADFSRDTMVLTAGGAGMARDAGGDVVVSNPFGKPEEIFPALPYGNDRELAAQSLRPPFDFIRVSAFLRHPEQVRSMGRVQARLRLWGIILLAAGIVAGAGVAAWQAMREVQRARVRGGFVMGLSHDLRTPLASMRIMAESLYADSIRDPDKRRIFAGILFRECERLSQLVERVLFLVRFDQDAVRYRMQPVDLAALVAQAADLFKNRFVPGLVADEKPLEVTLQLEPGLPRVDADDGIMMQVLLNLLDNAWKYGQDAQGGPMRINLCAHAATRRTRWGRRQDGVRVDVRDYGRGVHGGDIKHIFRPYYRGRNAADRNVSGVGLGLALCRKVVRAHHGAIEASCPEGGGAMFSIFLPAVRRQAS